MGGVEFHRRVVALLEAGTQFATARLVRVAGHSPQDPGAAMIVHPDGGIEFTIGGGPFEAEVIQDCVALLGRGEAVLQRTYDLTREALGMDCAGRVTVLLEAPLPTERLVVFGGGHVGARIAAAGAALGLFQVWVIDDREAFADAALHPGAHRVPSHRRHPGGAPRRRPGRFPGNAGQQGQSGDHVGGTEGQRGGPGRLGACPRPGGLFPGGQGARGDSGQRVGADSVAAAPEERPRATLGHRSGLN